MSKIYIVYWSGTGNTKEMADAMAEGVVKAGGEAEVVEVSSIKAESLKDEKAFALGCPSMGDEVLEEDSMEPFVEALTQYSSGKKIALFGSYGWGNCEWMRDWEDRMQKAGAEIVDGEGIAVLDSPDKDTLEKCAEMGGKLAGLAL